MSPHLVTPEMSAAMAVVDAAPIEDIVGSLLRRAERALQRALDAQFEALNATLAEKLALSLAAVDAVKQCTRLCRGVITLAEGSQAAHAAVLMLERTTPLGLWARRAVDSLREEMPDA